MAEKKKMILASLSGEQRDFIISQFEVAQDRFKSILYQECIDSLKKDVRDDIIEELRKVITVCEKYKDPIIFGQRNGYMDAIEIIKRH